MSDRRSILRRIGLLASGAGAGLLARPAVDAATTAKSDRIIERVAVADDRRVTVHLTGADVSGINIVDSGGRVVAEYPYVYSVGKRLITDPLEAGKYRAVAYRGEIPDSVEAVQEVSFEATRQ